MALGQLVKLIAVDGFVRHYRHPGVGDGDQASRSASLLRGRQRSPGMAPGPYSARRSPACSTRITPSRTRKRSVPSSPSFTNVSPADRVRNRGLDPLSILYRKGPLECGFDRRDQGRRILITPGRVPAERLSVPVLEVGKAGLGRELAISVVVPVAGKCAGSQHRERRWSLNRKGQAQGGPHHGRLPLDERLTADPAWCGQAGAPPAV